MSELAVRDDAAALAADEAHSRSGRGMAIDVDHAYRRFGPLVRRRCEQLLRDPEAAREAMHDVFVRLTRRRRELDDRALSGLFYRMATGICLNRLRDTRRRATEPNDELVMRIAQAADVRGPVFARRALERLFDDQAQSTRVIAVMHLLDGYTLEEVAQEVGLSVSGVRKRLRRLRVALAEQEGVA